MLCRLLPAGHAFKSHRLVRTEYVILREASLTLPYANSFDAAVIMTLTGILIGPQKCIT